MSERLRAARGAPRSSRSPPTAAAAPRSSPGPAWRSSGRGCCGWRIQLPASCAPRVPRPPSPPPPAALRGAASARRRPLPAAGFVRPPPRLAPPRLPRLPAPSAVPLPRRGRRERAGQRGVKPTRWRRGGIRRRAELGAEAASAEKKKCPPEETHKFYRGDRQPARGSHGRPSPRAARAARGPKRSRGPEATEPPAARGVAERGRKKPEPALPAKVNFNRGGWMQSPGGR